MRGDLKKRKYGRLGEEKVHEIRDADTEIKEKIERE